MITGIRQMTLVGEGGKIEISSPELPRGTLVAVIVLVEPPETSSAIDQEPLHSILELRGLGKELWTGVDPQQYINELRDGGIDTREEAV